MSLYAQWPVENVATAWGTITGTLSSQTDLQTALNAKQAIALESLWTTAGTTNNATFTTDRITVRTGGDVVFTGITGGVNGRTVTIINEPTSGAPVVLFTNESGSSTTTNRFHMNLSTLVVQSGTGAKFYYSATLSRWIYAGPQLITTLPPVTKDIDGRITLPAASPSTDGYLSSFYFNQFFARILGDTPYDVNGLLYATNLSPKNTKADISKFAVDPINSRMGIQNSTPAAALHVKSNIAEVIDPPSSFTVTQTQWLPPDAPSSVTLAFSTPSLNPPSGANSVETFTGSGYSTGLNITYRVYSYFESAGKTASAGYEEAGTVTITSGGSDTNINWSPDTSGTQTISGYVILRDISGAGYTDYWDVGNTTSVNDDNTSWTSGGLPYPQYPDFVSNGTTYNYKYFAKTLTPVSTDVYSTQFFSAAFIDTNYVPLTRCYLISHSISSSSSDTYITKDDATNHLESSSGFLENVTTFSGSGGAPSPTAYGYLSDGSALNISYDAYSKNDAGFYSSTATNGTSTDPNNSAYYYNIITGTSAAGHLKIIRNSTDGISVDSPASFYDDGVTVFGSGTTVTPTESFVSSSIFEGRSQNPIQIIRGLDSIATEHKGLSFRSQDDVERGYISSSSSEFNLISPALLNISSASLLNISSASTLSINSNSDGYLKYLGGARLFWNGSGVQLYGTTQFNGIAQFNAPVDAQSSFGASITTKTSNYTATTADYTILVNAAGGAVTITLPSASISTRRIYNIKKIDSSINAVNITASGSNKIDGETTQTTNFQWTNIQIQSDGTNWFEL